MTSFAFLPTSPDVAQMMTHHVPLTPIHSDAPHQASPAEEKASATLCWARAVEQATQRYLAEGDVIIKSVFCRAFYGAVLFESGVLVLIAPHVPDQHGKPLMPQDPCREGYEAVVDVGAGETHMVFCTLSGAVYTLGYDNAYGQLGDGSVWRAQTGGLRGVEGVVPPLTSPRCLSGFGYVLDALPPQSVTSNSSKAMAGTGARDDTVTRSHVTPGAAPGSTWYAPLTPSVEALARTQGNGSTQRTVRARRGDVLITSVACGAHHTLLLTLKRNAVYACGRGHCGQLSGPRMVPAQPVFRSIALLFGLPIESIVAAGHHSFVLLQTGRLFAFGANTSGQLGLGHTENVVAPTPVTFLSAQDDSQDDRPTMTPPVRTDGLSPTSSTHMPPPVPAIAPAAQQTGPEEYTATNGTIVRRSLHTSVRSTSLGSVSTASHGLGGGDPPRRARVPLLDAKTYQSLRAAYNSVESTQFPLRVMRLSAVRGAGEEAITAVYACAELTVVRTASLEWFSCGLPLSQGLPKDTAAEDADSTSDHSRRRTRARVASPPPPWCMPARADGRGPLGRTVHTRAQAHRFGKMIWPAALTEAMRAVQRVSSGESGQRPPLDSTMANDDDDDEDEAAAVAARTPLGSETAEQARSRRATNVPTANTGRAPSRGTAASSSQSGVQAQLLPLPSTSTSTVGPTSVECLCYETVVAIGVRLPHHAQTLKLFVLAAHQTALLDVHAAGSDMMPSEARSAPQSPSCTTVCGGAAGGAELILNALVPVSAVDAAAEVEASSPIRLQETASDAVMYSVCVGPNALLATPKGVLLM